ncbi:MAG: DegV family protein [Clostridia bacterium]|nr:DegV family protein [Clostridia bacterium]
MEKMFQIITDSSCDLPQSLANSLDLIVQPLHLHMNGIDYNNYLDGREIGFTEFFDALRSGAHATTSAVNPDEFVRIMQPSLEAGYDVLYIGFSSGLSTTYQSGCIAAEELREQYPQRKIVCIDSLCASLGQGLFVYLAAQKQQSGATLEETEQYLLDLRPRLCHWFTVDDLIHLKRGGRVSAAAAVVGTRLRVKPVVHTDNEGRLAVVAEGEGRKASLRALVQKALDTAVDLPEQTIFICHGDCLEDAQFVADSLREKSSYREVIINSVGPTIGAHTGAGVVALFFVGTER